MMDRRLAKELDRVATRRLRLRLWVHLALAWCAALAAVLGIGVLRSWMGLSAGGAVLAALAAVAAFAAVAVAATGLYSQDRRILARLIEGRFPDLDAALLTAVEQQPAFALEGYSYLQEAVIDKAVSHSRRRDWAESVDRRHFAWAKVANVIAAALLIIALFNLGLSPASLTPPAAGALSLAIRGSAVRPTVHVEPGDTEVERGASLLTLARFEGEPPTEATLVFGPAGGSQGAVQRIAMARSLDDPLFAARIPIVEEDLWYRVEFAGHKSDTFRASVFEYPRLERADAHIAFPNYTGQSPRVVEDVRRISAVEGSQVTLTFHLNKPLATAELVETGNSPATMPLTQSDDPAVYTLSLTLDKSKRCRLKLVDDRGRQNKEAYEFTLNAIANQPPDLKLTWPGRDVDVSPLEELSLAATLWDDFGLHDYGLAYSVGGAAPVELSLKGDASAAATQKLEASHMLALESLEAEPDQLVSYYFWAEDAGPDGQPRRTASDMFFAEVRPFEEIFRQGEQPAGGEQRSQERQQGQGGNAQQAEELAELQKQIVSATWNVRRRVSGESLADKSVEDVREIGESQVAAIEQSEALAERLSDEQSRQHMQEAQKHMQEAAGHLARATSGRQAPPMDQALSSAQSAYQSLLKLRAREHEVVRSQSQSSSSSSSSRSSRAQRQLNELELREDQSRYEAQRTAAQQEDPQQREMRQATSRLRELARRQEDLNKQLKDLQTALQAAQNEQEREEIRRQLKRLREQQEQILRDIDELQQRLDQPQNQRQMAETSQQLADARENVRQSAESLRQEMVSQALAAGSRAGEQFQEMRDELRRQSAGEFADSMREMRQAAQDLDQRQEELSSRLSQLDQARKRTLRDDGEQSQIGEQLAQQRERLSQLYDQMREVTQQAEQSEPLLSRQLYDAYRQANQRRIDEALNTAQQMVSQGFPDEAQAPEGQAREGIGQLRQGVERAARSVLGDEAEALRRARDELDRLANQLAREVSQRSGEAPGEPGEGQEGAESQDAQSQGRGGQPSEREGQEREGQGQASRRGSQTGEEGEQEQGQGQQGQRSPGEQQGEREGRQQGGQGQSPSEGQQDSQQQGQSSQEGSQQEGQGAQQGQGSQRGGQPSEEGSPSEQEGAQRGGQQPGQRSGQQRGGAANDGPGGLGGFELDGGWAEAFEAGAAMPLTGEGFQEWSDRLRDVEEMLEDADLRAEAARIRDRARAARAEMKRHSKEPQWPLVRTEILEPLAELQRRVSEELLRRTGESSLTPIDRDPAPAAFAEQVRQYFERLGAGR